MTNEPSPPEKPSRSLTQRTLWQVAIRIGLVVTAATVLSFWHVRSSLEEQSLAQLATYVEERRARESTTFELAVDNLQAAAKAYVERLRSEDAEQVAARFDTLFTRRQDGTLRVAEAVFDAHGISGFIGKHTAIGDDLRRRMVVAFDLLRELGPLVRTRFVNLYVVTPENAVLMYWPDQPWALTASDWEIHGKLSLVTSGDDEVIVLGDEPSDAIAEPAWSDLYYDYGINDWMVSATEPVRDQGRLLLSFGHDILLTELFQRTLTSRLEGTTSMIFGSQGRLIAHPAFMDAIQATSGALTVEEAKDPHLARVHALAATDAGSGMVHENTSDDEFIAVGRLAGPDWLLVTVFPEALIADTAYKTARLILLLGIAALAVEIAILFWALRNQVAQPLKRLLEATRAIASGRFERPLDVSRNDEIGQLARAFNTMAQEVVAREAALSERSAALAEVNTTLEHELKERERVEDEMARQREALHQSEKMNALGSMLAGVAHELNNPLSVVVGRSVMLEENLRDSTHGETMGKVRSAAERCAKIVKSFLAIARQEELRREPVCIDTIIDAALELVSYTVRSAGIEVLRDTPSGLPRTMADPDQLTQVFTNLFVNARQAMAESNGRRVLKVVCRADTSRQALCTTVEDSGPGIPEELRVRIFEPFFTTKPVGVGTGIGLSVSQGIVQSHGGAITVGQSDLGGARFEVFLPVEAPSADAVEVLPEDTAEPTSAYRVLVVDDEEEIGAMLSEILAADGHRVEVTANGRQALDALERDRFDLVMSDLVMPELDGPGLFREIEARYPEMIARVVFITGDMLSHNAKTFLGGTGRPVIEKPFAPEDVWRTVAEQLSSV